VPNRKREMQVVTPAVAEIGLPIRKSAMGAHQGQTQARKRSQLLQERTHLQLNAAKPPPQVALNDLQLRAAQLAPLDRAQMHLTCGWPGRT
jgi:hypothetical protein